MCVCVTELARVSVSGSVQVCVCVTELVSYPSPAGDGVQAGGSGTGDWLSEDDPEEPSCPREVTLTSHESMLSTSNNRDCII